MLIVIEGLDGAGKSTQVRKLRSYLESIAGSVEYIHFPRYDAPVYGDLIGRFLKGEFGDIGSVHPQLVALLFAEDRHGAAAGIKSALVSGRTVLLDRYVYSNIAYQCSKLNSDEEASGLESWICNTEYGVFGLPKPDLNIFLDVPISFVEKKLGGVRSGQDREYLGESRDIHESDIRFQRKVRDAYRKLCRQDDRFIRIDCSGTSGEMLPPDEIFSKIRAEVDAVFVSGK